MDVVAAEDGTDGATFDVELSGEIFNFSAGLVVLDQGGDLDCGETALALTDRLLKVTASVQRDWLIVERSGALSRLWQPGQRFYEVGVPGIVAE